MAREKLEAEGVYKDIPAKKMRPSSGLSVTSTASILLDVVLPPITDDARKKQVNLVAELNYVYLMCNFV